MFYGKCNIYFYKYRSSIKHLTIDHNDSVPKRKLDFMQANDIQLEVVVSCKSTCKGNT